MSDSPEYLAQRLITEGSKTTAFFEALLPQHWELVVYTDGAAWTIRQVLAHFVAAEIGMARLIQSVRAGGAGTPEDFNLDAYNERKVAALEAATAQDLIKQFATSRQQTVELVTDMRPDEMELIGRHPWLGQARLADIFKIMYRHNQIHLRDIRKLTGSAD